MIKLLCDRNRQPPFEKKKKVKIKLRLKMQNGIATKRQQFSKNKSNAS